MDWVNIVFVIVLLIFLLIAADTIRRILKERGLWFQEDVTQRVAVPAKVLRTLWTNELFRNEVKKIYYAVFELETGEQIKLRVPMSIYFDLFEREEGILHYEVIGGIWSFREFQKK